MKNVIAAVVLLMFAAAPTFAQMKPCEELLTEIDAKIQAKGIKRFSLEIVPNEKAADVKEAKVVGSCDGGTKKIVYKRGK
jgi:hypothetical protein